MYPDRKALLTELTITFGMARIVHTLAGTVSPRMIQTIEIKGTRDGAWRPLGQLADVPESHDQVAMFRHAKTLNEDARRAAHLFSDAA